MAVSLALTVIMTGLSLGNLLNLSLLPGTIHSSGKDVSARLQVHMERNQDGKSITIGLIMKICVEGECLFQKPIINHSELPGTDPESRMSLTCVRIHLASVPECTNHVEEDVYPKVDSTCSMSDLAACGPNQSCVQQAVGSQVGLCECLPGFVRLQDGVSDLCLTCLITSAHANHIFQTCISKAEDDRRIQQAKESLSSPISTSTSAASDSDEATSSSGTVAAIVISVLIVVVLLGAAAFVILRTRLLPRLRARLTNTPYEDIVIGKQGRSESRQNVIA